MKTLADFFNMGGYASYVWSAYGISAAILIWNLLQARSEQRQTLRRIKQRLLQRNQTP